MKFFTPYTAAMLLGSLTLLGTSTVSLAESRDEPMELRNIMQGLSKDMQRLVDATAREDWQTVEQAAMAIADHPTPPLTEKMRILAFMGSDVGKFKSHDGQTHNTAKELAAVAARQDGEAVISTFAKLQNTCLACHQSFRQSFVEHFYDQD